MEKPDLVLGFADTFDNCKLFFMDILSRRFNVIRDDQNPKFLIFGDRNFGESHHNFDSRLVKKIFYTGENVRPSYFNHDYAVTFDFENSPRHYRLPLYVLEMWSLVNDDKFTDDFYYLNTIHKKTDWEKVYDETANGFTYVQSNPNCQPRNYMVETLSRNFEVLCGGPHLNNIGGPIPRTRPAKMEFLKKKKMNIAFENGEHSGYVTEKMLDAFYAGVMPVYWGSDLIHRDFNPNCFIRITNDNWTQAGGICRNIMNDKQKWCSMMASPRFNEAVPNCYTNIDNFLDWFTMNVWRD